MSEKYLKLDIDLGRDELLQEAGLTLLSKYYLKDKETSPQHAFARAATCYCFGDFDLAQRIYDYASKGWFIPASPVLSNAVEIDWPDKKRSAQVAKGMKTFQHFSDWLRDICDTEVTALPISCFLNSVDDSIDGLNNNTVENRHLTVNGGGIGTDWSQVRSFHAGISKGGKSPGLIPFIKTVDSDMLAYRQGSTRRGSNAAYLNVNHPEINEFLEMRIPNGDLNRRCLNLHHAINFSQAFMEAVPTNGEINLVDPSKGAVTGSIKALDFFKKTIETRFKTGEPYMNFIDTVNNSLNPYLKQKGLKVRSSNLCNEIHLPTSPDRTAVCCLSSVNLEKFDEWQGTDLIKDLTMFLDNVLEFFICKAPKHLSRAVDSAKRERSLGLGAFGFHSWLQKKNIPFESAMAVSWNKKIFNHIKDKATQSSNAMGKLRGVPEDMKGSQLRNAHLLAIAPTSNIAIIAGTSPGIEPSVSNYYVHQTRAGNFPFKNKYLDKIFRDYRDSLGKDDEWYEYQWKSVLNVDGSVQHLDFLSDYEKDVFKTAFELDQRWVVDHAADRQKFVCQGQSLNLFFMNDADINYVAGVHYRAWKKGCKGLYYLRTQSPTKREAVGTKVERIVLDDGDSDCLACDG